MIIHTVEADKKTKEERIRDFIKSVQALEQAIEPFKEQRSDMKKSYIENGWLTKSEITNLMKAYRLAKSETDFAELEHMYNKVTGV